MTAEFWQYVGAGLMFLLVSAGYGLMVWLMDRGDK